MMDLHTVESRDREGAVGDGWAQSERAHLLGVEYDKQMTEEGNQIKTWPYRAHTNNSCSKKRQYTSGRKEVPHKCGKKSKSKQKPRAISPAWSESAVTGASATHENKWENEGIQRNGQRNRSGHTFKQAEATLFTVLGEERKDVEESCGGKKRRRWLGRRDGDQKRGGMASEKWAGQGQTDRSARQVDSDERASDNNTGRS